MRAFLGRLIPMPIRRQLLPIRKQLSNFLILSKKYGQYHSIKHWKCLDASGAPIPWYTYPATEYLGNIDFSARSVFEFGSGFSTLWWSRRAETVMSVEHDQAWYANVLTTLPSNAKTLLRQDEENYVNSIKETATEYDVIIIDGQFRDQCARALQECLKHDGLIILDNSDWYKDTAKYIRDSMGLLQVDFHGFGPINNYTWTTSLFFSLTSKIEPLGGIQPHYSIAAVRQ